MSDIAKYFFRNSYFTKVHEDTGTNNDNQKEVNLLDDNNDLNHNNNIINHKTKEKIEQEEELYFAEVDTIIPIDEKMNNTAMYNIRIKSSLNFNDSWIKSCTLDDLFKFRDYLLKYTHSVINLPFPTKSLFRFLPYIGYKYDERNWDILLENKFLLDDFFETICKDKEMYKLSGFISFFSKPSNKRLSNILFL